MATQLAMNLAKAIEIPEVRAFIKKETSGKSDGLNAELLQKMKDQPINSNNELARGASTFGEVLENIDRSIYRKKDTDNAANNLLDSLNQLYPTLHIAIPDFSNVRAEDWDGEEPLKVVYSPDKFAYEMDYLDMFDSDGKHYEFDHMNESDELVLVIGPNYHVKAIAIDDLDAGQNHRTRDCLIETPILDEDDYYYYYDAEILYDCQNRPRGGDGTGGESGSGSGGGTGDELAESHPCGEVDNTVGFGALCAREMPRWNCDKREVLVSFEYQSMRAFRGVNSAVGDIRSHRIDIFYGNVQTGEKFLLTRRWLPKRSDLRNFRLLGKNTPKEFVVNSILFNWD